MAGANEHKVLGILGSPRDRGNTSLLLQQALKGAASHGAETRVIHLSKLNIASCQHCDKCITSGSCEIRDDMQIVQGALVWADRLILASPIHFMGVSSQTKLMIDRCQVFWARKYHLKISPLEDSRERKGVFISVAARHSQDVFEGALATVRVLFRCLNVELMDLLLVPGVDSEGEISEDREALERAFNIGERLVATDGRCQ